MYENKTEKTPNSPATDVSKPSAPQLTKFHTVYKRQADVGIQRDVKEITLLMNKMTDKNYDKISNDLFESLEYVMKEYAGNSELVKITDNLNNIIKFNSAYSTIYSKFYKLLIEKYGTLFVEGLEKINVLFEETMTNIWCVDPDEDYDTQRDLESCVDSGTLKLETSAFSNFNDSMLPTDGSGTISGIITRDYFGDNRVMMLNTKDDVNFDSSRCDPLFADDFSSNNLNNWMVVNVNGEQEWEITPYGNPAPSAKISGYSGGSNANEDLLITNSIDVSSLSTVTLNFQSVVRYNGPSLEVYASSDYSGGDPTTDGNWSELSVILDTDNSSWSSWTDSGNVDLSSYAGGNLYIAFKYVSTSSASATYEIDNVLLTGE